jgi:hypothetical protein
MQPQPQYHPQQYPQHPPQQYPNQPQYAPPQQQAPWTPPAPQTFTQPGSISTVTTPRIRHFEGRLVLVTPTSIERQIKNDLSTDPNAKQDRLKATWVVLDGGQITYGGDPATGRPDTFQDLNMPIRYDGVLCSNPILITQLSAAIPENGRPGGMMLGRLVKGQAKKPGHNAPWKLLDATPADEALATAYLSAVASGQADRFTSSAARAAAAGVAQPQQVQPQYQQQAPMQQYPPQQAGPAGYIGSPDPGAQYVPTVPAGYPPSQPAPPPGPAGPWGPQPQQYPQQPQYGPPPGPQDTGPANPWGQQG